MRCSLHLLALTKALLICTLFLTIHASNAPAPAPAIPRIGRSWLAIFRSTWTQTVRRLPSEQDPVKNEIGNGGLPIQTPTTTFLARYGGDIVLRFNISTLEEAEAFREAVNVLFLDVWEFTMQWVDVRLSKDVVGLDWLITTFWSADTGQIATVSAWTTA